MSSEGVSEKAPCVLPGLRHGVVRLAHFPRVGLQCGPHNVRPPYQRHRWLLPHQRRGSESLSGFVPAEQRLDFIVP